MKRILLVEDSKFLRLANERALIKAGYTVVTASDGDEALSAAFTETPDLILLDMLLPKLGGPEVLKALRKDPLTVSTPVIVLSSLAQKNETRLKRDGATAYFEKSKLELDRSSDALVQIVKKTLGNDEEVEANSAHRAAEAGA